MRNIRRPALAGILAIAITAAAAACSGGPAGSGASGSSGSNSGRTITALVAAAGAGLTSQYNAYYSALAKVFHQETGATVKFQYYTSGAQENSIIQTSLVSGSGPDVVGYGSSIGSTLYATKGFITLDQADWNAVGGRSSWNSSTLSASGPSAQQDIGIPSFTVPYVIAYNKTLFAKAGISAPPATWDEWVTDAKKIQAAAPGTYGAGFDPSDPTDPWKFVWSYTHQLGGAFVSGNGKAATLDSAQVNSAMNFYFSWLYRDKIVPPDSLSWNNAQMVSAFLAGKVAMLPIATTGLLNAAKGSAVAGKIGFAQLPGVPAGMTSRPAGGTPAASIVSGQFWAIFQYASANKDLALALAKASNDPSIEKLQYNELGWAPTTKSGIEMLASQDPTSAPFLAIEAKQEATEFTPAWSSIQTAISTAVNKVADNLATGGSWNAGFLNSQLSSANSAVQGSLK